jgi:hypothetical protein
LRFDALAQLIIFVSSVDIRVSSGLPPLEGTDITQSAIYGKGTVCFRGSLMLMYSISHDETVVPSNRHSIHTRLHAMDQDVHG